ncbi:unnamed protein product [Bursaphelenchus okinawaensis]|uniref:ShKT domain-containing protein n=1 Tax=Bursaphelenchus okinawaensis TaxID=465554 RepID=A0A811L173_9BILA|nr:unnamed protein product [Bursaphelenchus okinawaensis]CAG9114347.1 unnamed protein product [Bursaphelenchus okinawaensis]
MRTYCPLTCGYCKQGQLFYEAITASPFFDDSNNLLTTLPPITYAPITYAPITYRPISYCVDKYSSCIYWARNGFCSNAFYPMKTKMAFCGKTCSLCT